MVSVPQFLAHKTVLPFRTTLLPTVSETVTMAPTTPFKPNLLKKDSLPAHDNAHRELRPYLLNGKLLCRVADADQFIHAELLHPSPTGSDLVQSVQNDLEGLLQAQD